MLAGMGAVQAPRWCARACSAVVLSAWHRADWQGMGLMLQNSTASPWGAGRRRGKGASGEGRKGQSNRAH